MCFVYLRSAAVRPKLSLSLSQFGGEGNPKSKQHREEEKKKEEKKFEHRGRLIMVFTSV
jgi:hypothetical protein